ncbi:MAG TPA: alpha/beta hydrolase [Acidobacteriaceae bacterium]|jgi:pimeloyl-ACP methyl ester carboxylesterase
MGLSLLRARTPTLDIAYEQSGPSEGTPVLLLHGFPYDVRQYDTLRKSAHMEGLRVIVPYLRGFGGTRYLSKEIRRSGQQAALGKDVLEFLDALEIEKAVLVGYDWGGRAACVAAALWPDRVRGIVSDGYSIQSLAKSAITPESAEQEHQFWYQWYFQTERGRQGLAENRRELSRLLWTMWSPGWRFSEEEFAQTARSFDNPDFVDTVIHGYRHRYANAIGDPSLQPLEDRLAGKPKITLPAITVHGAEDRVHPASKSAEEAPQFTSFYDRRILAGVGHCVPAEAPVEMGVAIADILRHG